MTAIEWLENIEDNLGFPESGVGKDPDQLLYATEEQCKALQAAHQDYCKAVERILFPDGR